MTLKEIVSEKCLNPSTYAIFGLLLFLAITLNNARIPFSYYDEKVNTECAREMLETKSFITPLLNYELRSDKPPLHYYFMMLAYTLFGVNEFSARFFSAVMLFLTIPLIYQSTKTFLNREAAQWTALALLSSAFFMSLFLSGVPDPYFVFFMTFGLLSFFHAYQQKKSRTLFLFYALLGLAALAKGPIAVILTILPILCFLAIKKELRHYLRTRKLLQGALIFSAVCLPWYIAVAIQTGGRWTYIFFINENFSRYATTAINDNGGPLWLTLRHVLIGFLPFSIFIIPAYFYAWKKRENDFILFSLLVSGFTILFFTFSKTKLMHYTLPAYPFLAVLVGYWLCQSPDWEKSRRWRACIFLSYFLYLFVTAAIPLWVYSRMSTFDYLKNHQAVFLTLPFLLPFAGAVGGLYLIVKNQWKKTAYAMALSWILLFFFYLFWITPVISQKNKPFPILGGSAVAAYKDFDPAYLFYLKKKLPIFKTKEELVSFLNKHPETYILSKQSRFKEIAEIQGMKFMHKTNYLFRDTDNPVLFKYERGAAK